MKNKLSQEYKDDLYEKVLEKKRQRTLRRKKMLSIFIVFVSVVGFTTLGFSLLGQDDYCNFFTSETENIMIDDEYQYFDDLGIKLEFINIDDNSLTLGINIKYEDIAEYKYKLEEIKLIDKNGEILLYDNISKEMNEINIRKKIKDIKNNGKSDALFILKYQFRNRIELNEFYLEINNIVFLDNKNKENIEFNYKREISIEGLLLYLFYLYKNSIFNSMNNILNKRIE